MDKIIDVIGFGATPNEYKDSTKAIKAAMKTAQPGDIIFFPSGIYYLDCDEEEGLPLQSSLSYVGQVGTVFKNISGRNFIFSIRNKTHITLEKLTFDGMGICITDKSSHVTIKDCCIQNCGNSSVPKCFGIYMNNVDYCYFYNNNFCGNKHCFFGESVSNSEWKHNTFLNDEEALHLIGTSVNNTISHNKLRYVGRIGIEIQDDSTGVLMEENDIRYMTGGMYGISFAAPYTRHGLIRNNVLVGGTEFKWGAGIEVMGRVRVEQNIVYDWQEGIQFNTGYQEYLYGPVLDGAVVKNNLLRNQIAIGIMKVECGDTKNLVIKSNFIENAQLNGIHFFWDQTFGALIEGNTIVRDAGYWPDDHIPFELRDIENYGDEDWFVLPVKRPDQNGYQYFNTSHYAGIRMRHNSKPANLFKNNYIIQRNTASPENFRWDGIVFDYKTQFEGTLLENNVILSNKPECGTGISYLYDGSLKGVSFINNTFENLQTVIKAGETKGIIASGNRDIHCAEQGQRDFAHCTEYGVPVLEAGSDQIINLPDTVNLCGKITSGRMNVKTLWEKFVGPGEVEFSDENQLETQASFSKPGCYVLSLNAQDGVHEVMDVTVVQVGARGEKVEPLPESTPALPPAKLESPIGGPGPSYKPEEGFLPLLLKVNISTNLLDPGDDLWVTTWWQNIGTKSAEQHLNGFMDMEFGNQRITENIEKSHRTIWQPYPGLHNWNMGEVWATTCRWHIPESGVWGGTFKLYTGFCDDENVPIDIWGTAGKQSKRTFIGDVDVAWGWGSPSLKKLRKPWSTEFCTPVKGLVDKNCGIPENVITIGEELTVIMDANRPVILGMNHNHKKFEFIRMHDPELLFRDKRNDRVIYSYDSGFHVNCKAELRSRDVAIYKMQAYLNDRRIAAYNLNFTVKQKMLCITLDNIIEEGNFELLEAKMPSLVSASGSDARMADFFADGRLISKEDTRPLGYEHPYDVRNAGAVFDSKGMLVVESPGLDDKLCVSVYEDSKGKSAVIGVSLVAKVRGRNHVRSISVTNPPQVNVNLLDETWGKPCWQSVARFLRQGLKTKKRDLYRRAMVYKYHIAWGPHPYNDRIDEDTPYPIRRLAHVNTFDKAFETIQKVHHLIDGGRQVVYLTGFQCSGHDTGYPYVLETDPRAGTIEELKRYIGEAPKYNAYLGMHDNYDDAYYTDYLPREILALNEEGKPYKLWFWSSDMSYAIGPCKYAELALMQKRVKQTVETYGIHTTYHLDVLSSEVKRHDFDMTCPTAADANLKGKLAVIEEFNKYGIDITSENVTHPFAGAIGYAWWTRYNPHAVLFPGEKNIPLTPMVYHGVLQYNCSGTGKRALLQGMIWGANTTWSEMEQDIGKEHIRAYYIQTLPMGLLYDYKIEDYQEIGSEIHVEYENNSSVRVNMDEKTYSIIVEGRVIAQNWTTFAPGFREGSYLAYSVEGGKLCYQAPEDWHDDIILRAVKFKL